MVITLRSGGIEGVDAYGVDVEVAYVRQGMPGFTMVGLAEAAVREAKERVFSALRASLFRLPPARITVNLAPAGRRKTGTAYDLPLAMGLLVGAGLVPPEAVQGYVLAGEVSLSGELKPVKGILPIALLARTMGARGLIVPPDNAQEAAVVQGLSVFAPVSLLQCVAFLTGEAPLEPSRATLPEKTAQASVDFAEVKGQQAAKRALEIAAAGGHNILMMGPPGSGKTMLAQRLPTILPPLDFEESLEVTKIYSVAGQLEKGQGLITERPFRAPHHTISDVALIGGGVHPRPGEVSLAHRGVLFLDELPEYKKTTLEVLRQPLEDGSVSIARAAQSVRYPADCMLVAAMNPCPCGYLGDSRHECRCRMDQLLRYRTRLSGPLLDRIDVHIEVPAVSYDELRQSGHTVSSQQMRERVVAARSIQQQRYQGTSCRCNAGLSGSLLEQYCQRDREGHALLEAAVQRLGLSARAYTRILRLARTIADLAHVTEGIPLSSTLAASHLAEAITLRVLDREAYF